MNMNATCSKNALYTVQTDHKIKEKGQEISRP